ncbi:MAG TPA: serine/threonine-protein kinase [Candidatus Brocadiia bacterium]|nr:serine/threonine-protein kinase [Candidatus Brocadiia bacterium]
MPELQRQAGGDSEEARLLRILIDKDAFDCCTTDAQILQLVGCKVRPVELAILRGYCTQEELNRERMNQAMGKAKPAVKAAPSFQTVEPKRRPDVKPEPETVYIEEEIEEEAPVQAPEEAALEMFGGKVGGYTFKGFFGRGPLSWVYQAEKGNGELFRVKIFPQLVFKTATGMDRFMRRSRMMQDRLTHPNIARPVECGALGEQYCYLVEEWINGVTLNKLLEKSKGFSERVALATLRLLAKGLYYAHQRGIMHGNIKPSNVIISKQGAVFSIDWSSPRTAVFASGQSLNVATAISEDQIGYSYLTPELLEGDLEITPPTDIYAMGILLYEMITGKVPYNGNRAQVLAQISKKGEIVLQDAGPKTRKLLSKMTSLDADKRYDGMDQCMTDLEEALAAQGTG